MEQPSEIEPVGWADLPDEIVEHIYENLSAGDYIRLGLVDKRCQAVFKSTKIRYKFMLLTHNLVDVNPDQPPVEKLQELEERIEAWSTLVPRKTDFEYVVNGPTSIYELQEGIFLHTEGDIDWVEQLRGVKPHLLKLVPLPWVDDELEKQVPAETRDVGFDIADLTFDPTQDLIVISEKLKYGITQTANVPLLRYHLLTISSLQPHPLATRIPLYSVDDSTRIRNVYQLLQVFGDILAVSATPANSPFLEDQDDPARSHMVRIWNWKTGESLGELVVSILTSPPAMILLDEQRFLLVIDHGNRVCLDIYGFNGLQDDNDPGKARLLTRFSMNSYKSSATSAVELRSILARPDPPFPSMTMKTPLGKLKPFTEDPATGLMVLSLQFVLTSGAFPIAEETVVFLLKEELLKMAKAHEKTLAQVEEATERELTEEDRTIEWNQWKHLTRVIDEPEAAPRWVCFVHGYRYATRVELPAMDDDDDDDDDHALRPSHVQVFDFSPNSIRRFEVDYGHMLGPSREHNFIMFEDYTVQYFSRKHPSKVFLEESRVPHFETNLPYLVTTRTAESYDITGVMIDEARIILSHEQSRENRVQRRSAFTVLTM